MFFVFGLSGFGLARGSKDIGLECANLDKDQGLLAPHVDGVELPTRKPRRPFELPHPGYLLSENNL